MVVDLHGKFGFFPGGGACCVDGDFTGEVFVPQRFSAGDGGSISFGVRLRSLLVDLFAKGSVFLCSPVSILFRVDAPSAGVGGPGGVWLGETASPLWFSLLQTSPSLADVYSDAGVGSVSYIGVWFFFLGNAFGVVFPGAGVVDWFSGKVVEGGRRAKLEESTADDLSPSISCSFPKLGVHSLISKGEDGRLKIRFAALAGGKQWRKSVRRKMMNSSGKDLVVIRRLLKDLSIRMECTVLSFSI